jgi:hypothetical protein
VESSHWFGILQSRGSFRYKLVERNFIVRKASLGPLPFMWWYYFQSLWGINLTNYSWDLIYNSGFFSFIVDLSWSDIKCFLCRHEEIDEGSRVNFNQVNSKVGSIEQLNMTLL